MLNTDDVKRRLGGAFTQEQADILTGVLSEFHVGLATSVDMQDLKDVVKALAVAQARSEERLEGVETRMDRVEATLRPLGRRAGAVGWSVISDEPLSSTAGRCFIALFAPGTGRRDPGYY